ncbi:Zinc finger MYND domain-containing protein 10 [Rhizophlyctis rosea]|uniref:Zinc finger MYND domain-containing protein 10 n=1 Tax=Rhizophlyctis rosea TaxID=64517 RepID=A0AAD5SHL2_9FUNG|nr:Zinc finger MYND domain-containing protein 10 [Rhizophlyctis rosea]
MKHHEVLEKLNIQAHANTQQQSEEYVTEALITFDKVRTLIYDLLVTEAWKNKIFPVVHAAGATKKNSLKVYFMLYHEATIVNLFEIVLFNKDACVACGDAVLDLIDYCSRKLTLLNAWCVIWRQRITNLQAYLLNLDEGQHLSQNKAELDFSIAINTLSLFRYLTDYITDLSLSAMTRILNNNDMICSAVYLIERAPWLKRTSTKEFARFDDGAWKEIPRDELPRLGKVWLVLYNLLIEPECREKYEYTAQRQSVILRLQPYLNETLVDQLPILKDLERHLVELSLMKPPENVDVMKRGLLVEQIPEMYNEITNGVNWKQLAEDHKRTLLGGTDQSIRDTAKSLAAMYDLDEFDSMLEDPKCAKCGHVAMQRCSRCKNEWYCGRVCQVKAWKSHKPACDLLTRPADQ